MLSPYGALFVRHEKKPLVQLAVPITAVVQSFLSLTLITLTVRKPFILSPGLIYIT